MKMTLALLALSLTFVACSDDEASPGTTNQDTGTDVEGPITTRPDDGVDTNVADTATPSDSSADTTAADTSPSDDAASDTPAGLTIVTVGAGGFSFSPATVNIKVGEKVRWVFTGAGHNVVSGSSCTADNKFCNPSDTSCATAPLGEPGTNYEHTFTTAGTFPYFCMPHCSGGMTGSVVVAP